MSVKIKLKRIGKKRNAQYRIVVADSRTARGGRAIEEIGIYQPKQEPSLIQVNGDRAQYWLGVGAQPTEAVAAILRVTGDWQKFKGLPGAEGTLKVAAPKADKKVAFEAAVKQAASEPTVEAVTPKKKPEPVKEETVVETAPVSADDSAQQDEAVEPAVEAATSDASAESTTENTDQA